MLFSLSCMVPLWPSAVSIVSYRRLSATVSRSLHVFSIALYTVAYHQIGFVACGSRDPMNLEYRLLLMEYPVSFRYNSICFRTTRALSSFLNLLSRYAAVFHTVVEIRCSYPFPTSILSVLVYRTYTQIPENFRLCQQYLPVYLYGVYGDSFFCGLLVFLASLIGYKFTVSGFPISRLCHSASLHSGSQTICPK